MTIEFLIPTDGTESPPVNLGRGKALFILGPNGTGKSALIHQLIKQQPSTKTRLLVGYRQNYFQTDELSISDEQVRRVRRDYHENDRNDTRTRYQGATDNDRVQAPIAVLKRQEHVFNKNVREAVDGGDCAKAKYLSDNLGPIKRLNRVLRKGALTVEIELDDQDRLVARNNGRPDTYSIARMSDGERSAMLLACEAIIAEPDCIIFVDEPERHLHRAVMSPLIRAVIDERPDCYFVIATHEVGLAQETKSPALILHDITWTKDDNAKWDLSLLATDADLPEDLLKEVLGARQGMLFIEGAATSLDAPIYNLLFPWISILPRGGNSEVSASVRALRNTLGIHRVHAFGLIDRDQRTSENVEKLRSNGVYALPVHSVESLYYGTIAIKYIARDYAMKSKSDASLIETEAKNAALAEFRKPETRNNLTIHRAVRAARSAFEQAAPKKDAIASLGETINLPPITSPLPAEQAHYDSLLSADDVDGIFSRYKVRSSNAPDQVAAKLGHPTREGYEKAVLDTLAANKDFLEELRGSLEPLSSELKKILIQPPATEHTSQAAE